MIPRQAAAAAPPPTSLSACERFQEIAASDHTDQNRRALGKWLKDGAGAFDWRPLVK